MIDRAGCSIGNDAPQCLRLKPGDEADSHRCIFTELGVGYQMPKGEAPATKMESTPWPAVLLTLVMSRWVHRPPRHISKTVLSTLYVGGPELSGSLCASPCRNVLEGIA